jgi:hypothetical protein
MEYIRENKDSCSFFKNLSGSYVSVDRTGSNGYFPSINQKGAIPSGFHPGRHTTLHRLCLYGSLYQWSEMMQYTTQQGAQGICPPGWRLPVDEDWPPI